jgi:hypothetical protein
VISLLDELALPKPRNIAATVSKAVTQKLMVRSQNGLLRLSPLGRSRSLSLFTDIEVRGLSNEAASVAGPMLGLTTNPVIDPSMAPPALLSPLRTFLAEHPFNTNVFAMTRFPDQLEDGVPDPSDPVQGAVGAAKVVCEQHGLTLHLASDRMIVDDLWSNVLAHMWACRYGIAFFENTHDNGLNYNLTIEVGGMLLSGRRCALLKDQTVPAMPTDLVGQIYKSVDLGRIATIQRALHMWIRDDLALGSCSDCPPRP